LDTLSPLFSGLRLLSVGGLECPRFLFGIVLTDVFPFLVLEILGFFLDGPTALLFFEDFSLLLRGSGRRFSSFTADYPRPW